MKKKLIGLAMAGLFLGACGKGADNPGSGDASNETGKENLYIIGIDDTFAPMSFRNAAGKIVGFDVDLAEETGKIMGAEFIFQPIDWVMKETELNAGNIDLIWNGYSITPERKQQASFSVPYLDNKQIIVTRFDSEIKSKADLAGKTVATQQSSSSLDALNADSTGIVPQFEGGEPVLYPTFLDVFNDLDSGRSDAAVVDEVLGRYIMKEKGADNYRVLEEDFGEEEYGVGFRKEDKELKESIDRALEELKNNGKYDEIYKKWFGE